MPKPKTSKEGIAHWWDLISHHPLWAALIATLLAAAIIVHSGGIFSDSPEASRLTGHPAIDGNPLRFVFRPVASEFFAMAFEHNIGLPKAGEGWEALNARGGVDVGGSDLQLTLANRSDIPLTVTSIEAVIRQTRPGPAASLAYVYTQGAEILEGFAVALENETIGTTALFYRYGEKSPTNEPVGNVFTETPPFFHGHDIALAPHEIYEAKVQVSTKRKNQLEYYFVISGNTPTQRVTYRSGYHLLSGWGDGFNHYANRYYTLPPHPGECWGKVSNNFAPRCP